MDIPGRGIKSCELTPDSLYAVSHASSGLGDVAAATTSARSHNKVSPPNVALRDVLQKTAAFFHGLSILGCAYAEAGEEVFGPDEDLILPSRSSRGEKPCNGRFCLERCRDTGSHILRCEHRKAGSTAHFFTSNLHGYDLDYLAALLHNDLVVVNKIERDGLALGFGPLAPCTFITSARSTRGVCRMLQALCVSAPRAYKNAAHVHRDYTGKLNYGVLVEHDCTAKADWYVPRDLQTHPRILLVVRGIHNHVPPPPTNTPAPYLKIVHWLLSLMEHRLAIATPRLFLRDEAVRAGMKRIMPAPFGLVPCVSELHPSLDNYDHLDSIIKNYRTRAYPFGTDWAGVNQARFTRCSSDGLRRRHPRYAREAQRPPS